MYLDYAVHPTLKTQYQFPRRQADLTVPNTRRNPVFIVPGGGGPINPRGQGAFDREPNIISYQFQINPIGDGSILDDARAAFLHAIDHGLPQTLAFRDDNHELWFATCVLVSDPHHQTAASNASHLMDVSWVMLTDYLLSPATPGTAVYGLYFKYGLHVKYGAQAFKVPLTTTQNWFKLDNSQSGATAATTDPLITLKGPYGALQPTLYPIQVVCSQSGMGFKVLTALGANDTLEVDLASRRVRLNNAAAFGVIQKNDPTNPYYFSILPDYQNDVVVQLFPGATPIAPLNGQAIFQWRPKRSL